LWEVKKHVDKLWILFLEKNHVRFMHHVNHLPAEEEEAREVARFHGPHEDAGRQEGLVPPPRQGQEAHSRIDAEAL